MTCCKVMCYPCRDAMKIRQEVFVEEQGFRDEFDETDKTAAHIVMYDGSTPVATCRCFESGEEGCYMIGRMAVLKPYRGRHLGSEVLGAAEDFIVSRGGRRIVLNAQLHARNFYEKNGYAACGAVFLEEGCEHVRMEKEISCTA